MWFSVKPIPQHQNNLRKTEAMQWQNGCLLQENHPGERVKPFPPGNQMEVTEKRAKANYI